MEILRSKNIYILLENFAAIKMYHKGEIRYAYIDRKNINKVIDYRWYMDSNGYIATNLPNIGNKHRILLLHRLIMNTPEGMDTDHKNDKRNFNIEENLRICTRSQNEGNTCKRKNNSSGYKGVTWFKRDKKWKAQIVMNYKNTHLGYFDSKEIAAKAYDKAAIKYHGKFAQINFK